MSQIQELTDKLQRELYSKYMPGEVLLNLREKWLEKFLETYKCNVEALMLGFMFSDYKLQEATELRKQIEHIRMAHDYAEQAFERYSDISQETQKIVLEIIDSHHGGTHKYIESKLFKNADALAFLEPKGWMHFFASKYDNKGEDSFKSALKMVEEKIEEKSQLVDLDDTTIAEAKLLKEKYEWFKGRLF